MMKRLLPLFLTVLLLSACGERDLPAESSLPESSAAESSAAESQAEEVSEEPSSEESTVTESAAESSAEETALTPVRTLEGDYEAMVPAQLNTQMVPRLSHGDVPYYTVLEGGKWGLIDENGTELLPCGSDNAVTLCFDGQWVYSGAIDNWDAVSAELEKNTGHALCPGHGGSTTYLFATAPGQIPQAMHGQPGSSYFQELLPEETRGDAFFPVKYGDLTEEETGFTLTGNVFWNFADAEGNVLCPDEEFDQVGWFSGEALAPVQKDGKWAYVDAEGNFATEFVYESCWGSNYFYNPDTEEYELEEPCYTYSLWDGFAPVVRDGQWGVLDETGKEIIPCQYEAGAPYPGGAFLKKDGVWGLYLLED